MEDDVLEHSGEPPEPGIDEQLRVAGLPPALTVHSFVFNNNNSATQAVDSVRLEDGRRVVRKVLISNGEITVPHWAASTVPGHWNYWRREADAYLSGVTQSFRSAGIRSPELLGICDRPGETALFIEHVAARTSSDLSPGDLSRVARKLGQGQGTAKSQSAAHLAPAWWSYRWIEQYAGSRPVGGNASRWNHETVVEGFGEASEELRVKFAEVLSDLPRWAQLLDSLPQTVCHHDLWANNLLAPTGTESADVLIDWSCVGTGAVGEDAGNLVPDGLLDNFMKPESYAERDAMVADSYLSGLSDVGWPHSPDLARLAMCAAVVKFAWLPALMVANVDFVGATGYGGQPGLEVVDVFRLRAPILLKMLSLLDEARDLIRAHGLSF